MINHHDLFSPYKKGVYQTRTASACLSSNTFQNKSDFSDLNETNWQEYYEYFHELAHYYQFSTTSYGLLSSLTNYYNLFFLNDVLKTITFEDFLKLKHSYVNLGRQIEKAEKDSLSITLKALYQWSEYTNLINGSEIFDFDNFDIYNTFIPFYTTDYCSKHFGAPNIFFLKFKREIYQSQKRFDTRDLLESHAHALAILWLFRIMEENNLLGLKDKISLKLQQITQGPYVKAMIDAPDFGINPKFYLANFCIICDIALNPNIFNLSPIIKATINAFDTDLNPAYRFWWIFNNIVQKNLPVPMPGDTSNFDFLHEFKNDFVNSLKKLNLGEFYFNSEYLHEFSSLHEMTEKYFQLDSYGYLPKPLLNSWLDKVLTYRKSELLRENIPFLLTGLSYLEIKLLIDIIGLPTIFFENNIYPRFNSEFLKSKNFENELFCRTSIKDGIAMISNIENIVRGYNHSKDLINSKQSWQSFSINEMFQKWYINLVI